MTSNADEAHADHATLLAALKKDRAHIETLQGLVRALEAEKKTLLRDVQRLKAKAAR